MIQIERNDEKYSKTKGTEKRKEKRTLKIKRETIVFVRGPLHIDHLIDFERFIRNEKQQHKTKE